MRVNRGTVYRVKNPLNENRRYRGRVKVYLPDGSTKDANSYGRTNKEARAKLDQKIAQIRRQYALGTTQTLHDIKRSLLAEKELSGKVKRKSIHNNEQAFKKLEHLADKPITTITYDDLLKTLMSIQSKGHYRTADLVRIFLNELYKHALKINREKILHGEFALINIAADLPTIKKPPRTTEVYIWTDKEMQAFLEVSKQRYDKTLRSCVHPLYVAMLSAGLRLGEALGIQVENHKPGRLEIRQQFVYYDGAHWDETPKTQASIRDIPISEELDALLNIHKQRMKQVKELNPRYQEHNLLFPSFDGTPFQPANLRRTKAEIAKAASVPDIDLHTMRKIYCTLLTKQLVQTGTWSPKIVMQLLGHSNPNVAQQIYAQVIKEDLQQAIVRI